MFGCVDGEKLIFWQSCDKFGTQDEINFVKKYLLLIRRECSK